MAQDTNQDLKSEIEYIKQMAEKGDKGPLNIGRALLWAGAGALFYMLARSALDINWLMPKDFQYSYLYFNLIGYLALMGLVIFLFGLFIDRHKIFGIGEKSISNSVAKAAWLGVLLGFIDFVLCFLAAAFSMANNGQIADTFNRISEPPAILGALLAYFSSVTLLILIGVAWLVTANASGKKWLNYFAYGCLIAAPVCMYLGTMNNHDYSLLVSLVLFCILPAFLSLRDKKA